MIWLIAFLLLSRSRPGTSIAPRFEGGPAHNDVSPEGTAPGQDFGFNRASDPEDVFSVPSLPGMGGVSGVMIASTPPFVADGEPAMTTVRQRAPYLSDVAIRQEIMGAQKLMTPPEGSGNNFRWDY